MNIKQIKATINSRSNWLRKDEVLNAINSSMQAIYQLYLKECPDTGFIKWDTSTVALIAGQEEYTLPADIEDLLRVRERINASDDYRLILTGGLTDAAFLAPQSGLNASFFNDPESVFKYFGPYRDAAAAAADLKTMKFRIAPIPQEARQVELVYRARYTEIDADESFLFLPDESHDGLQDIATAEVLDLDDDSRADKLRMRGMQKIMGWIYNERRKLRGNERPQVEPYID
jgi:hypothetical protein